MQGAVNGLVRAAIMDPYLFAGDQLLSPQKDCTMEQLSELDHAIQRPCRHTASPPGTGVMGINENG